MTQRVHVATYLEEATIQRIDAWANKLGISRSRMLKLLTDAAVQDEGWIIDAVTSKSGLKIASFLKSVGLLKPSEQGEQLPPPEQRGALRVT